eukprot:5667390-Amphidinium_carterae.1
MLHQLARQSRVSLPSRELYGASVIRAGERHVMHVLGCNHCAKLNKHAGWKMMLTQPAQFLEML